ncbi:hypothetical protein [Acrocarpospora phusangensis]|nr:hypothetical protein [Acrocarpospora phusangensis]
MSETSEIAARPLAWHAAPWHALRIAAACAVPLLLWFTVGRLVRWALLLLAATISHGSWYQVRLIGVLFLFTLVVMVSLATTVGMLHAVRGALRETRARRAENSADESALTALNRTALALAGIYLTWGFVTEDVRDFMEIDALRDPDGLVTAGSTSMQGLIGLDVKVSLATMAVAFLVKTYFGRRHEAGGGRFSGITTTFAELAFVFYGLNAVFALTESRSDWIGARSVVAGWQDVSEEIGKVVPGWAKLGDLWPFVIDGLAVPLTWLTIGILVYGAYAEDTRTTIRGTRLENVADRLDQAHSLTRTTLAKLTGGWTSRWIPLLNSLRLTVKGGAPLFGMFALCYVGLQIGGSYLERAGFYLAPHEEPYFWMVTEVPIQFVKDAIVTTLSLCLVAATYDIAATRARAEAPQEQESPQEA